MSQVQYAPTGTWKRMLEDGQYALIREIAAAKQTDVDYTSGRLQATLFGLGHRQSDPGRGNN